MVAARLSGRALLDYRPAPADRLYLSSTYASLPVSDHGKGCGRNFQSRKSGKKPRAVSGYIISLGILSLARQDGSTSRKQYVRGAGSKYWTGVYIHSDKTVIARKV